MTVITHVRNSEYVFQAGIEIQKEDENFALETMARAGADLFITILLSSSAGLDSKFIGEFLRRTLRDLNVPLRLQIISDFVPIPWAWLYGGDISDGKKLTWDNFIGMRHVVDLIRLHVGDTVQTLLALSTSTIPRDMPHLEVSVNVNKNINPAANGQAAWWREEVIKALADIDTADQILYFYCHANAASLCDPVGPGASYLRLTDAVITLREHEHNVPTYRQLRGNPLIFINACESTPLSPTFYASFVPYVVAKGARGVVGTESPTPVTFGSEWAKEFFRRFLDGEALGQAVLLQRLGFLKQHGNPLGLIYALHCDADTRIQPPVWGASDGDTPGT